MIRTAGRAAWAAPVIVAASAAPAFAASGPGAPAVVVSDVGGVRRGTTSDVICQITFTNSGPVDATALSATVRFDTILGSLTYGVSDLSPGWTSTPYEVVDIGAFRVTFTRAAGLKAAEVDTLSFKIRSPAGATGNIIVMPPTTTPTGANGGSAGLYGDA